MLEIKHPDAGILEIFVVSDKFAEHDGGIGGAGILIGCGQSGAIHEVRIVHTQFGSPIVHVAHKRVHRSAEALGYGDARVVGGRYYYRLDQIVGLIFGMRVQECLAAAHRRSVLAYCDRLAEAEFARIHGVERKHQSHDFYHACHGTMLPRILLVKRRACCRVHQKRGRCVYRKRTGFRGSGAEYHGRCGDHYRKRARGDR